MEKKPNSKILIIEDEENIRDLMEVHLSRSSYQVLTASDAESGFANFNSSIDVAVIDWMLPGMSGLELMQKMREKSITIPILMVTARAEPEDIVRALESGADDYVIKPFDISVFLARIKSLLRRADKVFNKVDLLTFAGLSLNEESHRALVDGTEVILTVSEFKLLVALLKNQGKVLTRTQLIALVQGADVSVIDRTIDTHVFGIRKKIEPYGEFIETVRGVGYRLKEK